jgi:hypothetical protein
MEQFDFVFATTMMDPSQSGENDLMKSRTYKKFPKKNVVINLIKN